MICIIISVLSIQLSIEPPVLEFEREPLHKQDRGISYMRLMEILLPCNIEKIQHLRQRAVHYLKTETETKQTEYIEKVKLLPL